MKFPFSYKHDFFSSALMVSLFTHIGYAAVSGDFLVTNPAYSVAQAPSSMEVIILNDQQRKKSLVEETILTIERADLAAPAVYEPEREILSKEEKKDIIIPEAKGAFSEADIKKFKNPAPEYPDYARRQGWEGLVVLEVDVNRSGYVKNVRVARSSEYKILDDAALKTIRKWVFDPASIGGVALSSSVKIPVRFVLEEHEKRSG